MANLAVKVIDLEAACEWYRAAGATVSDPIEWKNGRRADVSLGWLNICSGDRGLCRGLSGRAVSRSSKHPAVSAWSSWSNSRNRHECDTTLTKRVRGRG
jgi:hypothetical protein